MTLSNRFLARRGHVLGIVVVACCVALTSQVAHSEQTWGYVVGSFSTATYADADSCPEGLNPEGKELDRRNLLALGFTPQQAQKILVEGPGSVNASKDILPLRGRIDGKPVNVFTYPESVPDPHIKTVQGLKMYGFNLDGKVTEEDFQDPATGEEGIDNQLSRAVGCLQEYHVNLPVRPLYESMMWNYAVDTMPAWLISITGSDLPRDGPVTVRFLKATHHPERAADQGILADVTYLATDKNPSPKAQSNTFKGQIENGVLIVKSSDIVLQGESPILTELNLLDAHVRLKFLPDGRLQGFVGGYQPWLDFYFMHAALGSANEQSGNDVPGIYYALKRLADADPDPVTGVNRRISAAYHIKATPAYLATLKGQLIAVPGKASPQGLADEIAPNAEIQTRLER
jgi:hypothetical protein